MTQQDFTHSLKKACRLAPGSHVLVAVSGGADSVALLRLFADAREDYPLTLSCAHVEHGIRGADSQEDCAFVQALCKELGVQLYAAHVDAPAYAKENGCGLEEAARALRYGFLHAAANQAGADVIALAHHAQDQAETVLMRAARGSDVRGLCAMRHRRGNLIRPLLDAHPDALRAYLRAIGQPWREDKTNAELCCTRNVLRHEVMPRLSHVIPGAGDALCRLSRAAQRDEDYFMRQLDALRIPIIALVDGVAAEKKDMAQLHPALLSRLVVRLMEAAGIAPQSDRTIGEILLSLDRDDAVINLSGGAHAAIGRRYLCLVREKTPQIDMPLSPLGITDTPFGRFEVRRAGREETGDGRLSQVMPAYLLEGLRVTNRREGDTMIPFGKRSAVKLKKLMIDAGIERAMRASVPVLRRGDTVLLAVGLRPAQAVRSAQDGENMLVRFLGEWPASQEERKNQEEKRHD